MLVHALGFQQAAQAHPGDDAPNGEGHAPGKAVHKAVVLGGVLHQAVLHAAPHEGVQVHLIQVADTQDGVHLGKALGALPLAHALAGDLQQLGQLLLGLALSGAEELKVFGKCHIDVPPWRFRMVSAYPNRGRNSTDFLLHLKILLSSFGCAGG